MKSYHTNRPGIPGHPGRNASVNERESPDLRSTLLYSRVFRPYCVPPEQHQSYFKNGIRYSRQIA